MLQTLRLDRSPQENKNQMKPTQHGIQMFWKAEKTPALPGGFCEDFECAFKPGPLKFVRRKSKFYMVAKSPLRLLKVLRFKSTKNPNTMIDTENPIFL
jgi:hypothetical protein